MNPIVVIIGLVVVLLAIIFAWTGMALAWGLVMVLAVTLVAVVVFCIAILLRWPG